jgi:hypothetical protein
MSYTINHYNGTIVANIADGTLDTSTSLKLAGRNYAGYGEYLNENQVFLLENFAGTTAPVGSTSGQIWYNSATGLLNVYNGSAYNGIATTAQLAANVTTINSQIRANVDTINTAILANVATLNSNAASQDTEITNLWANAASQATNITNLLANAGVQADSITTLTANAGSQSDAIDLRATINSPTLTGNPRSVTASSGDNSTTIATTAYVITQDDTRRTYIDTNLLANVATLTSYTNTQLDLRANIASPTLTGVPAAPTAAAGTANTQIATTSYVMTQDATRRTYVDTNILANIATLNTSVNNSLAYKAPVDAPTFTGAARAVTAASGDNSTKVATTAFVQGEIATGALWQGSHRYISTTTPNNGTGADGDFWFQYEA